MDLNDSNLCSFLIRVFVESDEARFTGLDELDQPWDAPLSASSFPALSLLVAIKMNGPAIKLSPHAFISSARTRPRHARPWRADRCRSSRPSRRETRHRRASPSPPGRNRGSL